MYSYEYRNYGHCEGCWVILRLLYGETESTEIGVANCEKAAQRWVHELNALEDRSFGNDAELLPSEHPPKSRVKMVKIDRSNCNNCMDCLDSCPSNAIRIFQGIPMINPNNCNGCGFCVSACKTEAIGFAYRL